VVTSEKGVSDFMNQAKLMGECLHAYGIHSATLQPEYATSESVDGSEGGDSSTVRQRSSEKTACQITCGELCEDLTCCG